MHAEAIKVLKGRTAALLAQATRHAEFVSHYESLREGPVRDNLLTETRDKLAEVERHIASIEASIRTLQAQRPIHAVSASFAPGVMVKITNPHVFTGELATITEVADDGILSLRIEGGPVIAMKPSDVLYA
jgi:hypothetical protein